MDSVTCAEVTQKDEWEAWQNQGFDKNSVVADPKLADPKRDDYRLLPGSPAFKLGSNRFLSRRSALMKTRCGPPGRLESLPLSSPDRRKRARNEAPRLRIDQKHRRVSMTSPPAPLLRGEGRIVDNILFLTSPLSPAKRVSQERGRG